MALTKIFSKPLASARGSPYEVSEVHSTGGEGEGENACTVISVGTQFFRKTGFYASFDGYDWDSDFIEVFPVVRPVTFYEAEKPAATEH